jgi:hypothetical protein
MRGVRGFVLLFVFAVSFSAVSFHAGAQTPDVTILPEVVSVDSSLLVKVDPMTSERPIRITWSVYNTGNEGVGSFPITDGKGLCYFSNDDGNATCGPSPFFQTGETELYVYVITPTKTTNNTIPLNVSSLQISTENVDRVDNTVYMYFYGKKDWFKYSIYKEDLSIYQSERVLVYNITEGRYRGSITLNPGVYYFAFVANDSGTYGGALKRIDIPSENFLIIDTNKDEYWTGEKIRITGTTNSDSVTGRVNFPDGTKAKDFSINVKGDQTFSHEFFSQSDWPEGEYEIKTDYPLVKSVEFSITEFFELTPEYISETLNKSDDFEASIQLKNLRVNSTNVSFTTTGDMESGYVTILDAQLSPQETTTIRIQIPNVESDIDGTITLTTPEGLELGIPVSLTVTEEGECPECPAGEKVLEIDKDYLVWSQECVVEEDVYNQILITNNGQATLSDFIYLVEDTYTGDQSLESLDSYGYIDIPVYDLSIRAGESEYLDIKITPAAAGKYQGLITIKGGGDSAFIFVDLNCFEDVTANLESLNTRLSDLNPSQDISDEVSYYISNAQDAFSLGNYQLANEYYGAAKAKIEILELGGVQQPMDFTWVLIVVIVVVILLVVFWFFKFKRPQISQYEEETESLEGFE